MLQPTPNHVPHPFLLCLATPQEPKTASDTPAGAGGPATPGGGAPGTQQPGGPQGPAAAPCADNTMLIYMGLFLALMYFMVMRPEQKRRKEQMAMLSAIKAGDRVVTAGGVHGIVNSLDEKTVTLRIDTIRMTVDRTSIARVVRDEAAADVPKKA